MNDITELAKALEAAEKALQHAANVMIRDPALVSLVGRKVMGALGYAHKARQKLAGGPGRGRPRNTTGEIPTPLETQEKPPSVDLV